MNAKTLQVWKERALARQATLKRKPRRARQVFYVFASDFAKLKRRLGRRLSAHIIVEDAHIMDVDECSRA
jgi:hypothetical protein